MKIFFGARVTWREQFGDEWYVFKGRVNAFSQEVEQEAVDPIVISYALVGDVRSKRESSKDWYRNPGQRRVNVELLELDGVG